MTFSIDDKNIVLSDSDGFIHVWDVESEKRINHFKAHNGSINCVQFSPYYDRF